MNILKKTKVHSNPTNNKTISITKCPIRSILRLTVSERTETVLSAANSFLRLNKLSVLVFWDISCNVKPPEWANRISCPLAEPRRHITTSQTTETGALSLVTARTGCFDSRGSLVKVVSDQRGSSILRQGCHSVMLLGNSILLLSIAWQA